jgi:hypothetical protein
MSLHNIPFYCDTHETVKEALSYGFKPVILGELAKTPIEKGWIEKYTSIAADVLLKEASRRSASNVGILVGHPSGIICIDVDIQQNGMSNWVDLLLQKQYHRYIFQVSLLNILSPKIFNYFVLRSYFLRNSRI